VANPSIYILSGLLPVEAEVHKKALNLFGNICRSSQDSVEWRVAERQLGLKNMNSHSWFVDIKKLFTKYEMGNPNEYLLYSDYTKLEWKNMINKRVNIYWAERITFEAKAFNSLQHLHCFYRIGQCHPIAKTHTANRRDISRIPTRLKIVTGSYILQTKRAVFNKNNGNATCNLCKKNEETLDHFILTCSKLDSIREPLLVKIINTCSQLFAKHKIVVKLDLLTLIVNPYYYCANLISNSLINEIGVYLEPLCRTLCYSLHTERYKLLGISKSKGKLSRNVYN